MPIVKIKSIKKLRKKNDRYDLIVPKNRNFFANNILIHNTSARTGRMIQRKKLGWFGKLWNRTLGCTGLQFNNEIWRYVSGSRKVVLDPKKTEEIGFYSGKKFRSLIHQRISNIGLYQGETLYYEIVGYDS